MSNVLYVSYKKSNLWSTKCNYQKFKNTINQFLNNMTKANLTSKLNRKAFYKPEKKFKNIYQAYNEKRKASVILRIKKY